MTVQAAPKLALPVNKRDHRRGSPDAAVVLVEYGDFECPHCGQAYLVVKRLENLLEDSLCVVFRHFPLTTVHPLAEQAAEASECAGAQDKFWEMHDTLFEHQPAFEAEDLLAYATELGLDVAQFVRDMNDHRFAPRVREDFLSGVRSGVNGTPTFFINGMRADVPYDLNSLLAAIQKVADEEA